MLHKGNSYYSDWFSLDGKRHRKAHKTELAAQRHQNLMRRENARPQTGARSARPSRPSSPRPTIQAAATANASARPSSKRRQVPASSTWAHPKWNAPARPGRT
jgi:hypothetical protein